ncbi:penicillin acylase family protein, partial [bacterium]|nr:penicillin acylase family protein [bacterium]
KYYATPDRFMRIQELLKEKERLSAADFETIMSDVLMVMGRDWTPLINQALNDTELSNVETEALRKLNQWDFKAGRNQVAPTVFNVFTTYLAENTFKKRLGPDLYQNYVTGDKNIPFNVLREALQKGESAWFDDPDTAKIENMNDVLVKSYKDTIAFLQKELGDDVQDWQWKNLHEMTILHPFGKKSAVMGAFLNLGTFPVDGSLFTVNPTYFKVSESYKAKSGGASFRYIIDFKDSKNSKRILPGGTSGNFMSPHYDDQLALWRAGKFRPFVLDRDEVLKDSRYRLTLSPGKK